MTDKPEARVEKQDSSLSAAHLSAADIKGAKLGSGAKAELPAAFKGSSDLTIVDSPDKQIARSIADARAKMSPEQLARAEYQAAQPTRWIENAGKPVAQIQDKPVPPAADDAVAQAMAFARSRMTPEQIRRAEHEADGPRRYIQAAGQIDAKHEHKDQVTAKPGDSYWSVAHTVVSDRKGSHPTNHEIHGMVRQMAALNGKTMEQANQLKVGESIKIPPLELKRN